ncbi:penicillin-binding transpeptidase domain-containing protein [Smaragdicoccus niigatensis]|uniref:penicillin-binding transpeptidase domain-containing protein n=1 Tax=Smaragdicoccus niigatensis TaxID=359359 RepID=UPI000382CAC8|nr:penicillin-binding transpeptidase domain-containing protein [Smaragdicoccus niigatensis]
MNTHALLRRSRIATTLVAIGVTAASTSVACSSAPPSGGEQVALAFSTALSAHDAKAAANLTTDPANAEKTINDVFTALGKDSKHFVDEVEGESGHAKFAITSDWTLALNGQKYDWRYQTTGKAVDSGHGWKLSWDPAVLVPKLVQGASLTLTQVPPPRANVVDRNDKPIMVQQIVTRILMLPGVDTAALAGLLSPIDHSITPASLAAQVAGANGQPVTAITLRPDDMLTVGHVLQGMQGVVLAPEPKLLFADPRLRSGALSGLNDVWGVQWNKAAGWSVNVTPKPGAIPVEVGYGVPKTVNDIHTTLDLDVFAAAKAAVSSTNNESAIVAIKPSTGEILALAQNDAADAVGPVANNGLFPPGSTFKIVTSYAAIKSGAVTPDTVVGCPGVATIKGRTIPNDDNFDLGNVPLHTAFAKSCNTTFAQLAADMKSNDLTSTAQQLGLVVDWAIPGMTTVTGSVPVPSDDAERIEDGIGQGKVTASPFGMALVAASIANGKTPTPSLIKGRLGKPDREVGRLDAKVCDQIRTMMRETITSGTATDLNDIPGLIGKTGTAEYGDGHAHGWFVGIVGDMAFAVLVAGADSNTPAKNLTGKFLRALNH